MSTQMTQAIALLYPEHGRRARDVKFFMSRSATVETLAQQVVACFDALGDDSSLVEGVDGE